MERSRVVGRVTVFPGGIRLRQGYGATGDAALYVRPGGLTLQGNHAGRAKYWDRRQAVAVPGRAAFFDVREVLPDLTPPLFWMMKRHECRAPRRITAHRMHHKMWSFRRCELSSFRKRMMNSNLPAPLNAAERAILAKVYHRYGLLKGSTPEKLRCLKMDIGAHDFDCGPGATPEMNLLAYERIYLLTRNRGG